MNDKTTIETLTGPAKINGKRRIPGDKVDVTAKIKKQLQESNALPLPVDGPVENEDFTPEALEDRIADGVDGSCTIGVKCAILQLSQTA